MAKMSDAFAAGYSRHTHKYFPFIEDIFAYDLGSYFRLQDNGDLSDIYGSGGTFTATGSPATGATHPRIIMPGRGRRIHKPGAVTTRRVSLGGYYKSTGNRVVLVG